MKLLLYLIMTVMSFVQCTDVNLSCQQIREFVDGHNARRLLVAQGKVPGHPGASEMKKLVWDDELHHKAARWASRNMKHRGHNPDKTIPSGRFTTSENLYSFSTTNLQYKLQPESVLNVWFNEHKNYTFSPLSMAHFTSRTPHIGHYTQMVWSETMYVGCAISKKLKRPWLHFTVVCNYGPPGNYVGRKPYEANDGASDKLICDHQGCTHPYGKNCSMSAAQPRFKY